jgi:hypothetical protein
MQNRFQCARINFPGPHTPEKKYQQDSEAQLEEQKPLQQTLQNPQHTQATFESTDSQTSHSRQRAKSFHQNRCRKALHHYYIQRKILRQEGIRPTM